MTEDATILRTSLVPGILKSLHWNLNRGIHDLQFFELSKVYSKSGENRTLILAATRRVACAQRARVVRATSVSLISRETSKAFWKVLAPVQKCRIRARSEFRRTTIRGGRLVLANWQYLAKFIRNSWKR